MKFMDLPIINCHVHPSYNKDDPQSILDVLKNGVREITDDCDTMAMNVLCTASGHEGHTAMAPICALLKAMYPTRIYAFGSLDYPFPGEEKKYNFLERAKQLMDMGFDGFKMIEGKPTSRKWTGIPLDSELYDEFYEYLEKEQIPVLFHVADPDIYWDPVHCPKYARELHWDYLDGTYVSKETLHQEAEGILKKFPKLKIIFAHFYFMSKEIVRASAFLDRYENVSFDLTPGSHEYENFTLMPEEWRKFFINYQDRILFGTDSFISYDGNIDLSNDVRTFLEYDGPFTFKSLSDLNVKSKGIALERGVLEKIYMKNFLKYVDKTPRKLNFKLTLEECKKAMDIAEERNMSQNLKIALNIINKKMESLAGK